MSDFHVIIPARYDSSRLPGKPLADIAGKPMVVHVMEAAVNSGAESVTVATDDQRIVDCVKSHGGIAMMTSTDHESGTDRLAETCDLLGLGDDEVVVNVQGDEPLIPSSVIKQVAALLHQQNVASMATLSVPINTEHEFADPAVVKVVCNVLQQGIYFSRAMIPWVRGDGGSTLVEGAYQTAQRHLGIYAYRAGYLKAFASRPPSPLEQLERLEQLRVLWHGEIIACDQALEVPEAGVDNEEDLLRVRQRLAL